MPRPFRGQLPRPSSADDPAGVRERQRVALGKPGTWIGIQGARHGWELEVLATQSGKTKRGAVSWIAWLGLFVSMSDLWP